jgi:hypothetical protein
MDTLRVGVEPPEQGSILEKSLILLQLDVGERERQRIRWSAEHEKHDLTEDQPYQEGWDHEGYSLQESAGAELGQYPGPCPDGRASTSGPEESTGASAHDERNRHPIVIIRDTAPRIR